MYTCCATELEGKNCSIHQTEPGRYSKGIRVSGREGLLPLLAPHTVDRKSQLLPLSMGAWRVQVVHGVQVVWGYMEYR